jgi:D-sedoheptulose 7-phosphate isomerase
MKHDCDRNGQVMSGANANGHSVLSYLELHGEVLGKLPYLEIERIGHKLFQAYEEGRRVYLFGNGGSASLASHFACDLGKGTAMPSDLRRRFQVISLTDNIPLLTAWANDTSYELVFAEQLRNLVQSDDVVIAISASGNSSNVLLALQVARELGAFTIGLSGYEGGKMKALCDICAVVPSDNTQIIEDLHVGIAHGLFTVIRQRISCLPAEMAQTAGGQ